MKYKEKSKFPKQSWPILRDCFHRFAPAAVPDRPIVAAIKA
jgi:hypothetical protein